LSATLIVVFFVVTAVAQNETRKVEHRTNDRGRPDAFAQPTQGGTGTISALLPHSGPVMSSPKIYLIWYGNWNQSNGTDNAAGQQIIVDWANGIGSSDYFTINGSYPNKPGPNAAAFGGQYTYPTASKTRLTDNDILTIVNNSIANKGVPYALDNVYFVITSSNVAESSGFCSRYCGWHTSANTSRGRVRYSFVGNAARCLNACAMQTTSPNGNAGVDGAISVLSHELEEAATDPDLNAWYDSSGAENADKCAWTFGQSNQLASGAWWNIHFGSRNYLIQRNTYYNGTWFCARTGNGGQ